MPPQYRIGREIMWIVASLVLINVPHLVSGQSCGGVLTDSGSFSSPNYPYPQPNVRCEWTLIATPGFAVHFHINGLNIEIHTDVMQVYSGDVLVIQYELPTSGDDAVLSNRAKFVFIPDSSGHNSSYSVSFNSAAPACGGLCSGFFCSRWTPNFPGIYPKSSSCNWNLYVVGSGYFIGMDFTTIDSVPLYGHMILNSSTSTTSYDLTAVSTFTNSVPTAIVTGARVITSFTTVGCPRARGFLSVGRLAASDTCQATLSDQGEVTTPGFPTGYVPYTFCVYQLVASQGKQVNLTFNTFDVEQLYDTVRLYSQGVFFNSYSGTLTPFSVVLPSPVTLQFYSDFVGSGSGLNASFTSV